MVNPSPSKTSRWVHVATSTKRQAVKLPAIGYLSELLWLATENDVIVRRTEKLASPKLLQISADSTIVDMEPGELWMCIFDVELHRTSKPSEAKGGR